MKAVSKIWLLSAGVIFFIISCRNEKTEMNEQTPAIQRSLSDYWYQGKAEITHYDLEQARYGEMHRGDAVLIFVTEDFLTSKQVKLEDYSKGNAGAVPILKLNFTKTFDTGIYPYTMMKSVFSPLDLKTFPHALKINATILEWCGQVFTQINNKKEGLNVKSFSYFEKEGDEEFLLNTTFLEDEIWTRIRIAPDQLPLGDLKIIPGTLASRLRHKKLAVETAQADILSHGDTATYRIHYKEADRTLAIQFYKNSPHEIVSWEETYKDGFGENAKILTTKAVKKKSILLDYWNKHTVADSLYRKELKLH